MTNEDNFLSDPNMSLINTYYACLARIKTLKLSIKQYKKQKYNKEWGNKKRWQFIKFVNTYITVDYLKDGEKHGIF